jgi:predicted RNase H-like HicB family nuclease
MTTLIAVYNSSGCVGRCDAKCYNAQSPECDCICGGMNHGAGIDKAVTNTREMVDDWVEDYAKEKGLKDYKAVLNRDLVDQMSIFELSTLAHRTTRKS